MSVDYQGAFGQWNWVAKWTALAFGDYITNDEGVIPVTDPTAVMVSISVGDNEVTMEFDSEAGVSYQMQASMDLVNWTNHGPSHSGTGDRISVPVSVDGAMQFFRVIAE